MVFKCNNDIVFEAGGKPPVPLSEFIACRTQQIMFFFNIYTALGLHQVTAPWSLNL